jgi:hypothetical protein
MLAFEQSNIDGYAMRDLLSRTHSLRSFVYEVDGNNPYDVPFAPDVMVEALEQYSAHSLEEFQMVVNPDWAAMEPWRHIAPLRAFQKLRIVEVEAESLCREDDEDVTEDLKPLVESMSKTLEALALSLEQSEVLFEGFWEARENELKELKRVVLRHPDHGNAPRPLAELARSACGKARIEVEIFDGRERFPFYEAVMGVELVERPAFCANYPRNWDWVVDLMMLGSYYGGEVQR